MLVELQGFYLKLGQILAAKTDMLPHQYTDALQTLLDAMPEQARSHTAAALKSGLAQPFDETFAHFDWAPLASATVAQVHKAQLRDGRVVAVKVQHQAARRMMTSDLRQLRLLTWLLAALRIDIGFDIRSVILEYCDQVPLEFDFVREAQMSVRVHASLTCAALVDQDLKSVVVCTPVLELCTRTVMTMDFMAGVPVLHMCYMPLAARQQAMTALVKALGHMILRAGVFHSDPHPGNILALSSDGCDIKLGLLDFGQTKELSVAARKMYASLIVALAARNPTHIREAMRKAGVIIEGCSPRFEATACTIMFDTRMDFPEAFMSPADPQATEFRSAKVRHLPQELFMILRVVTLLRGLCASLGVSVDASQLWARTAVQVLVEPREATQSQLVGAMMMHSTARANKRCGATAKQSACASSSVQQTQDVVDRGTPYPPQCRFPPSLQQMLEQAQLWCPPAPSTTAPDAQATPQERARSRAPSEPPLLPCPETAAPARLTHPESSTPDAAAEDPDEDSTDHGPAPVASPEPTLPYPARRWSHHRSSALDVQSVLTRMPSISAFAPPTAAARVSASQPEAPAVKGALQHSISGAMILQSTVRLPRAALSQQGTHGASDPGGVRQSGEQFSAQAIQGADVGDHSPPQSLLCLHDFTSPRNSFDLQRTPSEGAASSGQAAAATGATERALLLLEAHAAPAQLEQDRTLATAASGRARVSGQPQPSLLPKESEHEAASVDPPGSATAQPTPPASQEASEPLEGSGRRGEHQDMPAEDGDRCRPDSAVRPCVELRMVTEPQPAEADCSAGAPPTAAALRANDAGREQPEAAGVGSGQGHSAAAPVLPSAAPPALAGGEESQHLAHSLPGDDPQTILAGRSSGSSSALPFVVGELQERRSSGRSKLSDASDLGVDGSDIGALTSTQSQEVIATQVSLLAVEMQAADQPTNSSSAGEYISRDSINMLDRLMKPSAPAVGRSALGYVNPIASAHRRSTSSVRSSVDSTTPRGRRKSGTEYTLKPLAGVDELVDALYEASRGNGVVDSVQFLYRDAP